MIKGIVIGILAYSAILNIFLIYKDNSSYSFGVDALDVIFGGPVCWVVFISVRLIAFIFEAFHIEFEEKEYKPKSEAEIRKIVSKIVSIYKKNRNVEEYGYDIFNLANHLDYDSNGTEGWDHLMVKKPRYEHINEKFESIMWKQEDKAIPILRELSSPVTSEFLKEQGCSEYFIGEIEDKINRAGGENYIYIP